MKSFQLKPKQAAPTLSKPTVFGSADDDGTLDAAPTSSANSLPANKKLASHNYEASKAAQKRMNTEKLVDSSVYEYDEIWDKMQEAKQRQKEAKEVESKERKPKYIHGLLSSAATRKLDHLRAEEKMMQREREAEGDEFADKESFVTQAYKDQMAEVRIAEEEEKRLEELRKKQSGPSTGMSHFYKQLLEQSEKSHEATVSATESKKQGPSTNFTVSKPPDLAPKSDLDLAKEAREQGREVELNDDNQIVDKRDLLSAGLNLSGANTRNLKGLNKGKQPADNDVQTHRAVGTAATRREINERRNREIKQQMEAERIRATDEQEKAEREARQRTVAKRNNEDDVQSARERYLQRKRQKIAHADSDYADNQ